MPCDSISLAQVHLGLANREILEQTLKTLADGGQVSRGAKSFTFYRNGDRYQINADGKLICPAGLESTADEIKRAYSRRMLQVGASKFGIELKSKTPQKMTLRIKR